MADVAKHSEGSRRSAAKVQSPSRRPPLALAARTSVASHNVAIALQDHIDISAEMGQSITSLLKEETCRTRKGYSL